MPQRTHLLKIARLVDVGQHRKAFFQACVLGHAHLRAQIVASTFDRSLRAALNFCVAHQRCRFIDLAGQVPINPRIAVLSFLGTCTGEDDTIQNPALSGCNDMIVGSISTAFF